MNKVKNMIQKDKIFYLSSNIVKQVLYKIIKNKKYYIYKYIKFTRLSGYYKNKKGIFNKIKYYIYLRKKNKLSRVINLEFDGSNFGENLCLYHENIVLNPNSKIGDNCKFHGNNCIGNNGFDSAAPVIGNGVDIGFGASIIGDVYIADNIIIGANALVNKSFYEEGIVIAGIPAKKIESKNN